MKRSLWFAATVAVAAASYAFGAETKKSFVDTYSAVADAILDTKKAETSVVRSILESHYRAAERLYEAGKFDDAAAEMSLYANEGDNEIGGVRKRLLAGGHHHNAEGEGQGLYDPGFVIVTKSARKAALIASLGLLASKDAAERKTNWDAFEKAVDPMIK